MRGLEAGEQDFTLSRVGAHDYARDFEIHPARNDSALLLGPMARPISPFSAP